MANTEPIHDKVRRAHEDGFSPEEFIKGSTWVFAKTYAKIAPHEYTIRGSTAHPNQDWFFAMVEHIRHNGYVGQFGRWKYVYLHVAGHKYWSMPGFRTINREPLPA